MSVANHAGTAEYQLPAPPSLSDLSAIFTHRPLHSLSSAAQTNALTCEGGGQAHAPF